MNRILRNTFIPVAFVALLSGCGGGSSENDLISEPINNTATSSVAAVGQIDGFGSVIVNGVRYNTDNAVIVVNGVEVEEAELKVGYIVTVTGEVSEDGSVAIATRVEYSAELIGPVENVDLVSGTITVLGQTVRLSEDTVLDDDLTEEELEQLLVNAVIEVSAFSSEDGTLVAAHIEIESNDTSFRLSGRISDMDLASSTVTINGQEVDISAVEFDEIDREDLSIGLHVVVEGSLEDDVFIAEDEMEEHDDNLPESDEPLEVEIEGLVSELNDNNTFELGGMLVQITDNTEFEHGERENLSNGLFVEVEGLFGDDGVLMAEEIEIHRAAEMEFEGFVESIDLENNTFTIHNIVISIDEDTSFDDDSDIDERRFNLEDISAGDLLHVLAFTNFDGADEVVAKRIRREDYDEMEEEEGGFEAEALGLIEVVEGYHVELHNGVTVAITDNTEVHGGELLLNIPREVIGAVIEVHGLMEDNILFAAEVEILAWCSEDGAIFPTRDDEDVSVSVIEICRVEDDEEHDEDALEDEFEEESNDEPEEQNESDESEEGGEQEDAREEEEHEESEEPGEEDANPEEEALYEDEGENEEETLEASEEGPEGESEEDGNLDEEIDVSDSEAAEEEEREESQEEEAQEEEDDVLNEEAEESEAPAPGEENEEELVEASDFQESEEESSDEEESDTSSEENDGVSDQEQPGDGSNPVESAA